LLKKIQYFTIQYLSFYLIYFSWQYNPLSRSNGSFWRKNPELSMKKTLSHHDFTGNLKESGYTNNHYTYDRTGWTPHQNLNGDQKRTEYRIQFNPVKEIHYKGPLYSTGKLRIKEQNYKHS